MQKGAIDMIVDRRNMRDELAALLALLSAGRLPRPVSGELMRS
jgi:acetyl-CoA carboxylase beta subunit